MDLLDHAPIFAIAAAMLLLAQRSAEGKAALPSMLGTLSLTSMMALYWFSHAVPFALLLAGVIALPLLDRTRFYGLCLGTSVATILLLQGRMLAARTMPLTDTASLDAAMLIGACMVGFAASLLLPMHPMRITTEGIRRVAPHTDNLALPAGWMLLAAGLAFTALSWMVGLLAAFVVLAITRNKAAYNCSEKAGQALVAGLCISMTIDGAVNYEHLALSAAAAFFVLRSEIITHALRLDDPTPLAGTIFIPCLLTLLIPGLYATQQLAPQLTILGAALIGGGVIALLVWPLTMAVVGLARPKELVRGQR